MTDCKYMEGKSCTFEHETTHEDCMLCMPNVMLIHVNVLLESVYTMEVRFGNAKDIYTAWREIVEAQKGFIKLMKEAFPEAVKRATIPITEPKGLV